MRKFLIIFFVIFFAILACEKQGLQEKDKVAASEKLKAMDSSTDQKSIWQGSKYEPTFVDMRLTKVGEHSYYAGGIAGSATEHDGFISNAGVVVTDDGVVIFDALGTPSLGFLLLSKIRNITDKPIKLVITSHYHADHIYGLQVFKEQGAEIWAPAGAKHYIGSDAANNRLNERKESLFPWVDENTYIVGPDVYVGETETSNRDFQLGGVDFSIISLGATHSQGDMMLQVNSDKVLFSGDLIFQGRLPFIAGNTDQWLTQLQKVNIENLIVIVPGHGKHYNTPGEAMKFTIEYLQYLHHNMGRAVEELIPFAEAYSNTDWSRYESLPAFVANRLNANYVYLNLEKKSLE